MLAVIALRYIRARKLLMCVLLMAATGTVHAAEPLVSFDTAEQRVRYDRMLEEYRCLKCQNQNLAGSNADLAGDLRREIRERILEGMNDAQIDDYLVARYGDFVRYKPRFGGANLVLWIGPALLLLVGLAVGVRMARRNHNHTNTDTAELDEGALERARELLAKRD